MNPSGSALSASGAAQTVNKMAKPKLLNQVWIVLRARHYSQCTESAYLSWIKRFILFQNDDILTIQELLGHKHVETTMSYTHVLNRGGKSIRSPADAL